MKRLRALHLSSSLTKINNLTTKELYLISTLLANKYLIDEGEDEQLFNSELMDLTGLTTERVNFLEKQILIALNWNLYVSNDEFEQFFTLFKNHMAKKLKKSIAKLPIEDSIQFYNLCFKIFPHLFEYLALTSLVLLGSTISILTAIHISTLTHSTLMKTFNPNIDCTQTSNCYWNLHNHSLIDENPKFLPPSWEISNDFTNETIKKPFFDFSSCSIDLLQPYSLSRPFVQTFG